MGSEYDKVNQGDYEAHTVEPDSSDYKNEIKDVGKIAALATKLAKRQKRIGNIQVIERVINLLASATIGAIMGYTLENFIVNQHEVINGTGPFGANPKLWPTYVMTAVAGITLIFNTSVLLAYCCGKKASDKIASGSSYVKLLSPIGHLIVWGTTAGSFKGAASGNDIWSFSCSDTPSDVSIQQQFEHKINYDMLCTTNTASLYTAIGTAVFAVIGIIIWVIVTVHTRKQKKTKEKLEAAKRFEDFRNSARPYVSLQVQYGQTPPGPTSYTNYGYQGRI
ncbi:hypothetical protein TWF569_001457 [Orbilia oligospora]|uniref:MARVEL domain-containing protein n=1 Tax=Orbilia oligospora TaxID=2813651 RepID=A0A7C8NJ43_ORBOL|nr:hypothetical protein TWF102_010101 [Orbilia oligospora]KAF3113173.1 hypothetical protein TWF706_010161 [Orbilia oligospora]KAF3117509.1 hypothetical protein TWF103_006240 [Orbilia oligospora]KAF3133836.1 hypothetical protein TWF703_006550 [Orbilia oligospora]KAF3146904.1 hypothetical protein TWF594_002966 [Orbilia oligospora]